MKKILSLFAQTMLISGLMSVPIACFNPLTGSEGNKGKPPEPPVKDIAYYQALITEQESYITDCDEMIEEIKANRDGYKDEADYQSALDEVVAEQYSYKSLINEYQYQILLLERENNKFTPEQIEKGIIIFTEQILNLTAELYIKQQYPDYYSETQLQIIRDAKVVSESLLIVFEYLKEKGK